MSTSTWFRNKQKASSFENQKLAADKKKALLLRQQAAAHQNDKEQPTTALAEPGAAPTEEAAATVSKQSNPVAVEAEQRPCFGEAGIRLHQDDDASRMVPAAPLARLVDIYLDAAATRKAYQVLMWPVVPQSLPLVHVLATMAHWAAGHKNGIRGLFFPAKQNTFNSLNHLFIDRDDLGRHAQGMYNANRPSDKDPILFRAINTHEVLPTINDLIPHFTRLKKDDSWRTYEDHLLEHTLKKVNRYSEKAALYANCAVLGEPKTAPDALFAFGYQLDRDDVRAGFRSFRSIGRPDVCLVNAARALRFTVPSWQPLIRQFLACFLKEFPEDRPGLVIVSDDPGVRFRVQELAKNEFERAYNHNRDTVPLTFTWKSIACQDQGEKGQGLKHEGTAEPTAPEPRRFNVMGRDSDAARLIKTLYQIRHDLNADDELAQPLIEGAQFLHKLAALPAGIRDLEDWLNERQADAGLRGRLAWSTPRGGLVEFIRRGHAQAHECKLEDVLQTADKLVANYLEATPMALLMHGEAGAAVRGGTRIAIVFTRQLFRILAERFLRRQSYPNGKSYADIEPHLRLLTTRQLREHVRSGWTTKYVFVGVDDESLRALMTENNIPRDSALLLTYRTALYTRWMLKPIFEDDEFRRFKPRVQPILQQLEACLAERDVPLLRMDDFVLPSFDFSATGPNLTDDPEAWRIVIEGGDSLYRSPSATVYIYDPTADFRSPSGFVPREVHSLEIGQQLFIMLPELRDRLEELLHTAGVPIEHDKPFEQTLRQYHATVTSSLNKHFPGGTLTVQVSALKNTLLRDFPEHASEFSNLRHWVNLGHAPETAFEQLRPQAPRHFKVFSAFAKTLGLSEKEIQYFWLYAIHPIRVNRRIDGRYVSDLYSRILFDAESVAVHARIPLAEISNLYVEARRTVHEIVGLQPPLAREVTA